MPPDLTVDNVRRESAAAQLAARGRSLALAGSSCRRLEWRRTSPQRRSAPPAPRQRHRPAPPSHASSMHANCNEKKVNFCSSQHQSAKSRRTATAPALPANPTHQQQQAAAVPVAPKVRPAAAKMERRLLLPFEARMCDLEALVSWLLWCRAVVLYVCDSSGRICDHDERWELEPQQAHCAPHKHNPNSAEPAARSQRRLDLRRSRRRRGSHSARLANWRRPTDS